MPTRRFTASPRVKGCRTTRVTRSNFLPALPVLFADALECAKELDDYFSSTGKLKGPLHGIPMSVKDNCANFFSFNAPNRSELGHELDDVKGYDTSNGSSRRCNHPRARDSDVRHLTRNNVPF